MPASLATVTQLTKEIYGPKIQDQLQNEAVGWKRIQRTSDGVSSDVGGKYVTFPLRVRRNSGIGYRNEMEALQTAGQQGYASVRIGLKYGYGRVRLSGQLMKLVKTNAQAFANAMELEMSGLKRDIQKDTSRIFYGDGKGTLSTCGSTTTSNTINVVSTQYHEVGQQIDIVDSATGTTVVAANRQITAVGATTVVIDGAAVSTTSANIIVRTGNYGREPNGLASLVTNTGSLFNLDPAVEPTWKATVDANGGTPRALSENLMIKNTDLVRTFGAQTSLILYSLGVRRSYFNLLSQQRRYPSTTEFTGGLKGLAFMNGSEIPCIEDVDAPVGTMYGLDEDSFKIYQEGEWDWLDDDNAIWKWVSGFDAYEAVLAKYWELGTNRRNANFVIRDIIEG